MDFQCNVCGTEVRGCPIEKIDREVSSCPTCHSSSRFRGVVHLLSLTLFGRSIPLPRFPVDPSIVGIGLSDEASYALPLAQKLSYTNTFFHTEPFFDICAPLGERAASADFLISTEVFEHVPPPAQIAFQNSFDLLKPGGALLLTVPFTNNPDTVEHFPALNDYRIVQFDEDYVLVNHGADGAYTLHHDLVFHGGPGATLEMRVYSRSALEKHLADAGFVDVAVFGEDYLPYGIIHRHPWSLPIVARKPGPRRSRAIEAPPAAIAAPMSAAAVAASPTVAPPSPARTIWYRDIPSLIFLACLAVTAYGLQQSKLLNEVLWAPSLITQTLVLFAATGVAAIVACIAAWKAQLRAEALLAPLLIAISATLCGPAATAMVMLFLFSSWCLATLLLSRFGRAPNDLPLLVTVVAGWSLLTILFMLLAPVPINTTPTHTLILAVPLALALALEPIRFEIRTRLVALVAPAESRPQNTAYLAGLVCCIVIMSFHLAMVAMPERYFDAMVSHLYIPSYISAHRAWNYDAGNYAFAYMPIGADMLYTHMFLLQGEAAARLLNYTAFLMTSLATFQIALKVSSRTSAVWAVALLVSLPLAVIESAALFTENIVAMFITAAVLVLVAAGREFRVVHHVAIMSLMAAASVVKLHGAVVAVLLGTISVLVCLPHVRAIGLWARLVIVTLVAGLAALTPYLFAWLKTGNPVLPLFNQIFKSPYFPPVEFVDSRWIGKWSPSMLYDATFSTSKFVEAYNGALGFTFMVFLASGIAAAIVRQNRAGLFCGALGLTLVILLSAQTQYLRYLLIFFPLLTVLIGVAIEHIRQISGLRIPLAAAVGVVVLLNAYKMPAGGWIIGVSDLRACCSESVRRQTELSQIPERVVNRVVNNLGGPMARVLYISNPFGALLNGTAIYSAWYNTVYGAEFATITTDEQFASLIARVAPTYVVLDTTGVTPLEKLATIYLKAKATLLTRVGRLELYQYPD
ncbi:MAG: Methyltransferase type 11 [Bradyrhizobium sp.]|nr:Methyltransferase type 11 [Bradyrhizobium sp.]